MFPGAYSVECRGEGLPAYKQGAFRWAIRRSARVRTREEKAANAEARKHSWESAFRAEVRGSAIRRLLPRRWTGGIERPVRTPSNSLGRERVAASRTWSCLL